MKRTSAADVEVDHRELDDEHDVYSPLSPVYHDLSDWKRDVET